MEYLRIFNNPDFGEVRTYTDPDGTVLLCGPDITRILGYKNSSKALSDHCKGVTKRYTPTTGGNQAINFITKGDLIRLAANSALPGTEKFESWIFDEVIPSVIEHGLYATPATVDAIIADPDFGIRLLTAFKEEQVKNKALAAEKNKLQIELDYSKEWYSIKRVAALNGVSWKSLDWHRLKDRSVQMGYGVKKVFDANYGEVNTYHCDVWEAVYPQYEL